MINVIHISRSKETSVDGGIATVVQSIVDSQLDNTCISPHWISSSSFTIGSLFPTLRHLNSLPNTIIHLHGLWFIGFFLIPFLRPPIVLSPHGMLNPWALRQSYFKKWPILHLLRNLFFKRISIFACATSAESSHVRNYFHELRPSIATFPHPIFQPTIDPGYLPPWKEDISPDSRVLHYFGRFHPVKNLSNLVRAWSALCLNSSLPHNAVLVFVGFGDPKLITSNIPSGLSLAKLNIFIYPPVFGPDKFSCFSHVQASILPSFSEGVPMSILESFSVSRPALLSSKCNLNESCDFGASLLFDTDIQSIKSALSRFYEMPLDKLNKLSSRSRQFIEAYHSPRKVSSLALAVYMKLLPNSSH